MTVASGSSNQAVVDVDAVTLRLPSPTPAVEDDAVPPGYPPMPLSTARGIPAHGSPAHGTPATPRLHRAQGFAAASWLSASR